MKLNKTKYTFLAIQSSNMHSITCAIADRATAVHFIGFTINCKAPLMQNNHAICIKAGIAVVSDCVLTSNSGPIACAVGTRSNLIIQSSIVKELRVALLAQMEVTHQSTRRNVLTMLPWDSS